MSMDSMNQSPNLNVFIYDLCMEKLPLHFLLGDAKFIGSAVTTDSYKLMSSGKSCVAVLNDPYSKIKGEVYSMSSKKSLGILDAYYKASLGYKRIEIPTTRSAAWLYCTPKDIDEDMYSSSSLIESGDFRYFLKEGKKVKKTVKKAVPPPDALGRVNLNDVWREIVGNNPVPAQDGHDIWEELYPHEPMEERIIPSYLRLVWGVPTFKRYKALKEKSNQFILTVAESEEYRGLVQSSKQISKFYNKVVVKNSALLPFNVNKRRYHLYLRVMAFMCEGYVLKETYLREAQNTENALPAEMRFSPEIHYEREPAVGVVFNAPREWGVRVEPRAAPVAADVGVDIEARNPNVAPHPGNQQVPRGIQYRNFDRNFVQWMEDPN